MPDEAKLAALRNEYVRLCQLQGYDPQGRGRRFNAFIAELLGCWGINSRTNERSLGEIDVAFAIGDVRYILEAKWERTKTDTGQLAKLQKRVRQRLSGTYGIFWSMSGYSPEALREVSHGERLEVLLLDSAHLEALLAGRISPHQLLATVRDAASFHGQAYTAMAQIERAIAEHSVTAQTSRPPSASPQPSVETSPTPPQPALPWNPVRADRGNPKNGYVTFGGRQGVYVLITFLLGCLVFVLPFIFFSVGTVGRIATAGAFAFCLFLMFGFGNMVRLPIRLEVGVNGMQVFGRQETTWIPWEVVDRVDIVRVEGNPHVVAWSRYASRYPDMDAFGGSPRFLPRLGAIAVCPMNVLKARRHDVLRALDRYAGNRI